MTSAQRSDILTSHRAILEYLNSAQGGATLFVANEGRRTDEMIQLARQRGIAIERVSRQRLIQFGGERARDLILRIQLENRHSHSVREILRDLDDPSALVLLLDHVTDPHNFGAILRSADQFGADAVIVPSHGSSPVSAVVMETSAGTATHVRIVTVPNLSAAIRELKDHDFWVYAAEMSGHSVLETDMSGRVALVLGSEGAGVSRLVSEKVDLGISIPIRGHADSLNVSVACGILLYEIRRQQKWL